MRNLKRLNKDQLVELVETLYADRNLQAEKHNRIVLSLLKHRGEDGNAVSVLQRDNERLQEANAELVVTAKKLLRDNTALRMVVEANSLQP